MAQASERLTHAPIPPIEGETPFPHPLRMLVYSQDGLGLGHMRRTSAIAEELLRLYPESAVVTVQDSPVGNFFGTSRNHDYVKLPSIEKLAPGSWRAVNLPLRFQQVRIMREQTLRSLVHTFRPHILLVDHMPHGAMGELRPALETVEEYSPETRVVLGLRDILDAPEVIRRRWTVEGAYEAIDRFYDRVLVYGSRDVFDLAQEYRFPDRLADKLRYCGYVCSPAADRDGPGIRARYTRGSFRGSKLLVAMAGGGADAYPMMKALVEAMPALRTRERVTMAMIVGPFMPVRHVQDLRRRASGLPVRIHRSVADVRSHLDAADLVVARAGYNSTMEILSSSAPALLIPRAGPSAEQRTRVRLFQERGWVDAIDPDDATGEVLAREIALRLRRPRTPSTLSGPDLGGLHSAVEHLVSLVHTPQEEIVGAGA